MSEAAGQSRGHGVRVALVLATSTGGVGRHVRSLAGGLASAGYDVTVCGPWETQERFDFTGGGVRFAPVEIPSGPDPVRDTTAITRLRLVLRRLHLDVVHAHGLRSGLVSSLARPHGVPLVVTWHNLMLAGGLRGKVYGALERIVARTADLTLCASEDLVGRVLALGGRDVRLGPVAAPSLEAPSRAAGQVREELGAVERPLLLTVARLNPQKSLDVLVRAAARWRERRPTPLVAVAGTGPSEDELRALIDATGAPVRLLGHRTDIADLLAASDIAVVTSQWEARQLFAQEALAAGRPLVATQVGGLPGLVGDAAVLVPAGDVDALDIAVRKLLDNPGMRTDLSERALAQAGSWPTESDTVEQIEAVYQELTGHP
ncbi:MAG: glycosyltransferase family 4 protein [Micromonosporaceae bacterium]